VSTSAASTPEARGEEDQETSTLFGRPRADELLEAVRELLVSQVLDATQGQLRHQIRVAANVLAMVERELRHGPDLERAHRRRMISVGATSEAELVHAIRSGSMDANEDLRTLLLADAVDRLLVANPRWLED